MSCLRYRKIYICIDILLLNKIARECRVYLNLTNAFLLFDFNYYNN